MAKRLDNNAILAIMATVVSVCALVVSVYQTVLMRQQQNASVWPKLVISNAYIAKAGDQSFYRLSVRNVGICPAIIHRVSIEFNGNRYPTMSEYAKAVLRAHQATDSLGYDSPDLLREYVIPQNEQIVLFNTYKSHLANYFIDNINQFKMTIEYESVYGQRWKAVYPILIERNPA